MTFTSNDPRARDPLVTNEVRTAALLDSAHLDSVYVDWASIVGGALVAVAIFTTLSVFGSAVGLSLTSADPTHGLSAKVAAVAVALWAAWVAASAFAAGGYITGRLRHRIASATAPEVEMRDGLHGLIAWALAALVSAGLLASALGGPAAVATRESAATTQQVALTRLFRGERQPIDQSVRTDAASLLKTISGHQTITSNDRLLLEQMVALRTGVPAAEANTRVGDAVAAIHESVDSARRGSVLAAFLLAASFAIGAGAAWIASVVGGRNRDEGTVYSPMTRWGANHPNLFGRRRGVTHG